MFIGRFKMRKEIGVIIFKIKIRICFCILVVLKFLILFYYFKGFIFWRKWILKSDVRIWIVFYSDYFLF